MGQKLKEEAQVCQQPDSNGPRSRMLRRANNLKLKDVVRFDSLLPPVGRVPELPGVSLLLYY